MAWAADRLPDDALSGEMISEQWSPKVLNHTRRALFAEQVCATDWKPMLTIGDKVHITVMTELTGSAVDVTTTSVQTAMNTSLGTTATSITIDTWWQVPVTIDDSVARQTHIPGLLEMGAQNAGYTWKKKLDGDITALFSSLTSTWRGADGQDFSDDILIALMEGLDEADVPPDRAIVGDPSMIADMRKIDKFMTFDYSTNPFRLAGYRGMIDAYGLPVYVTNNLTAVSVGNYGALLSKEAIGLVVQSPMDVEKWRDHDRHAWTINTSGFYGIDVLRAAFGAYFYTRKI